ncbi:hypothetical protein JW813_13225 [Clostridium botulinum]|uniref:DUF6883 domain-containing protein n=1 Tax=Clostridium botulinum TaxID=1491 RepID=UPI002247397B|nr:DUF6883 domain-containing protein [Clostridium botulinum]UZP02664.1 hypothetical protein JW813_13225 [Clostridium botulinum]UZP06022.1 hypothetical protein JYA71_13495 [Clostridium botulinum]UZP09403.1 hypothetical protein JYA74_13220 [Clostridium botulinum]
MDIATFFYEDTREMSHQQLAVFLSTLLKHSSNNCSMRIFDGLVLFECLGEKISSVKLNNEKEISFNMSKDTKMHIKAYKHFCNEIQVSQNSIKQLFSLDDFEKGIYSITVVGEFKEALIDIDKLLNMMDLTYKGYAILDYSLLLNYLLFVDYMEDNCMILDGKAIISDNIFKCDILEYLLDEQCTFMDIDTYKTIIEDNAMFNKNNRFVDEENKNYLFESKQVNESTFWQLLTEQAFYSLINNSDAISNFEINVKRRLSNKDIDDMSKKLLGYCLNKQNTKGKNKAIVFEKTLGFNKDNYYLLEAQLKESLKNSILKFRDINKYGFPFSAFIEVQGIDGNSKTIETGWIFEPHNAEKIRLVTAYVANQKKQIKGKVSNLFIEKTTIDYYKKLLQKAKEYAVESNKEYEITPMVISSHLGKKDIVPQGEYGYSFLEIKDKEFALWLINNKEARLYEGVCKINIDICFNYQLSKNYAEHMAEVFEINGISTDVVAIYD